MISPRESIVKDGQVSLSPSQRLHFDVYGYVLLENVLTADEVARLKDALYRLRDERDLEEHRVYVNKRNECHFHVGHVVEYDPALLEYAANPKLVPLAEEIVGGSVRLEESEAIINRRDPREPVVADDNTFGFHTGTRHGWGTYYQEHRFRCLFVKTLAYLTDVGPDDGGTAVIPGSHRLRWPVPDIVEAALSDRRLIHQVEAKAGSVLLFPESLVHSTSKVHSDRERVVLISGYTPPFMREWPGNEVSRQFVDSLPQELVDFVSGGASWHWERLGET